MPITVGGTVITFNDGTTQSTAATGVPASISAVGSIVLAGNNSGSILIAGATAAGSQFFYVTTTPYLSGPSAYWYTEGSLFANPKTFLVDSGSQQVNIGGGFRQLLGQALILRLTAGNTGFTFPAGLTSLPGTWRVLEPMNARGSWFEGYSGETYSYLNFGFIQRIA